MKLARLISLIVTANSLKVCFYSFVFFEVIGFLSPPFPSNECIKREEKKKKCVSVGSMPCISEITWGISRPKTGTDIIIAKVAAV